MSEIHLYPPPEHAVQGAHVSGMAAYRKLVEEAERDHEAYWARLAREFVSWKKPFTKVLDASAAPFYKWFEDGTLNVSYNCLDRNVERGLGGRVAIRFEADDGTVTPVTYAELLERTCRLANALKSRGVKKGDRVVIYMPMSVEGVIAMQACARIGATHSVVFGGFSAQSLRDRINDAGAVMVITADEQMRGGKALPLKAIVDEALALGGCETIRHVVVYRRTGGPVAWNPRDVWLHDETASQAATCEPEWVGAEHPLFLLYTSGSTGKPKGVQHSTGGYLLHAAATTKWMFDLNDRRHLLVHGRHRLGHRPHLHRLRPARARRHRGGVRGHPHLSRRRPLLEDDPGPQGHRVLHRAHGDPLAHQGGGIQRQGAPAQLRPLEPAHPRQRGRAHQSRPPGSGTTSMWAAAAARSSTPGGRPRPAAT